MGQKQGFIIDLWHKKGRDMAFNQIPASGLTA